MEWRKPEMEFVMSVIDDIRDDSLRDELSRALFNKYKHRSPIDASWLARDDAEFIVQNLDVILPILKRKM